MLVGVEVVLVTPAVVLVTKEVVLVGVNVVLVAPAVVVIKGELVVVTQGSQGLDRPSHVSQHSPSAFTN